MAYLQQVTLVQSAEYERLLCNICTHEGMHACTHMHT